VRTIFRHSRIRTTWEAKEASDEAQLFSRVEHPANVS
jgi:hypothetical protein